MRVHNLALPPKLKGCPRYTAGSATMHSKPRATLCSFKMKVQLSRKRCPIGKIDRMLSYRIPPFDFYLLALLFPVLILVPGSVSQFPVPGSCCFFLTDPGGWLQRDFIFLVFWIFFFQSISGFSGVFS